MMMAKTIELSSPLAINSTFLQFQQLIDNSISKITNPKPNISQTFEIIVVQMITSKAREAVHFKDKISTLTRENLLPQLAFNSTP